MADNNRGRPRDDDRDIYSSSREQRNPQRTPRYRTNETNELRSRTQRQQNRPERTNSSAQQNQRRNSGRTNRPPLLPTKILTAIIMSIVIFTVPRKNPKKNGGGDDLPPRKKKKESKKIIIAIICVVVAIIIGVVAFVAIMLSRINYKPVDTTSYVEQPSDAPTWDVISDNAITNILLLGVDRSEDGTAQRSDTMMLISINSKTKNLNMVSFLRDLYVEIPTAGKIKSMLHTP